MIKMWIARDKTEMLYLFKTKPIKNEAVWIEESGTIEITQLDMRLFPEVKWSDKEPTEVELKQIFKR